MIIFSESISQGQFKIKLLNDHHGFVVAFFFLK